MSLSYERVIIGLGNVFYLKWRRDGQEMSGGKEDEMDAEMCFESCQDGDVNGNEFPGIRVVLRIFDHSFCCG